MRRLLFAVLPLLMPVAASAALDVRVNQPDWVAPGEVRDLILDITNTGPYDLHNIFILVAPDGVTLRSKPPAPFNLAAHDFVAIAIAFQAPQQDDGRVSIDVI